MYMHVRVVSILKKTALVVVSWHAVVVYFTKEASEHRARYIEATLRDLKVVQQR